MIPAIVAEELRSTLLDYLETTFSFQDATVASALQQFLTDPQHGIFKGPFVQIRLPFRRAKADECRTILDITPPFTPYEHQIKAFERLTGKDNHQPQHTLVTTGTGSGKTECFLYPVLDHCCRVAGKPGIKAIILYPMNALASDQARRIAKEIWNEPRLKGRITAGLYVGGAGDDKTMGPENIITDRETLRKHPPDILLTNYKMLDFLLLRPDDQKLWKDTGPESVRYLVLDELHTYDGAQGSDVACLLRRLRAKLKLQSGSFCCVGTSATLAGDEESASIDLIEFACKLFGVRFPRDSVITEDRLKMGEYLTDEEVFSDLPIDVSLLSPRPEDDIESFVTRLSEAWFGAATKDSLEVGHQLRRHGFLRTLVMTLENRITDWAVLRTRIARWDIQYEALSNDDRDRVLSSFLTLISFARRKSGDRDEAFLTSSIQLWIREMSRLVREVAADPAFFWRDEVPLHGKPKGLPAVYCRECGHTGWLGFMRTQDNVVTDEVKTIYNEFFEGGRNVRYLFQGSNPAGPQDYVCPSCLAVGTDSSCTVCQTSKIPVHIWSHLSSGAFQRELHRCPACETNYSLTIVGSQAASLSSVAISHLYQSRFNRDKKLLAFTDSVQDASHRASFFGARTYRFNLRTAIQAVLEAEPSGVIPLAEFTDRMLDYWQERLSLPKLVATFIPPDLRDVPEYREFMENPTGPQANILKTLKRRLSWEISMEFGFSARVGRTLDKVLCSTAVLDQKLVETAVPRLQLELENQLGILGDVDPGRMRHFVVGLLTRTRVRGGVSHKMLERYAAENGQRFFLSKRMNRLMSPFSKDSRFPRFLSDLPNEEVFDSFVSSAGRRNWYTDFAQRSLSSDLDLTTCNDIYRHTIEVLMRCGLLEKSGRGNKNAFSIPSSALLVNRRTAQIRCAEDGHNLTVAEDDLPNWLGMPSLAYRGNGAYKPDDRKKHSYYRTVYRSGSVQRVFCHEHTGLLDSETRNDVEKLFKKGDQPDAPNLLACTPTLEMGIDVGDLSSTMVCSVPPTPTNYLQRIGRAGRSTGNALILALANVRPHDLYFFDDPFAMIAGTVTPPGCFLDAPEMLKRQYLAYCMDTWVSEENNTGSMPAKVMLLLSGYKKGEFPANFMKWYVVNKERLSDAFLKLFEGVISEDNVTRMRSSALSSEFPDAIRVCLEQTEAQVEEYRRLFRLVRERRKKIEDSNEKAENPAEILEELRQEAILLRRLISQIQDKYPLNLLTDEGLLPNYAFPETGVKLKSVIYGMVAQGGDNAGQQISDAREYIRGAGTAIRELAPFNTFYAEARKVVVDQVETGGRNNSEMEEWRFCNVCSHMEPELKGKEKATCPGCGSSGWSDIGQKRTLLKMKQVSARSNFVASQTADDSDERDRKSYLLKDFIDINPENWGGGQADVEGSFGFEYLKQVTLREINFGPRDAVGQKFTAAGDQIPEVGFSICPDCGVVRSQGQNATRHRLWCWYTHPGKTEEFKPVFLYRQVQSEAIRILLPVAMFQAEARLATFKACLELGLRKKFKGQPSHLIIREQQDPGSSGDPVPRRYLVLYDSVPGGTGYLKEFASNPSAMRDVLEGAFATLKSCKCRQKEGVDGCYRCLYAYQRQQELQLISRELGIDLLGKILSRWDKLEPVQFLSTVLVPELLIESELEGRFLTSLETRWTKDRRPWKKVLHGGKWCFEFETASKKSWLIEPQVDLGPSEGVSTACRPDFVIWPKGEASSALPVAVFADGFAYHVRPTQSLGNLGDDIQKRMGLIRSGKFLVWSVTWDDVELFVNESPAAGPNALLELGINQTKFKQILRSAKVTTPADVLSASGMYSLLHYLEAPDTNDWRKLVAASLLIAWLPSDASTPLAKFVAAGIDSLEESLRSDASLSNLSLPAASSSGNVLARLHKVTDFTLLSTAAMEPANRLDTSAFRPLLRIEDRYEQRQSEGFRDTWRKSLHASNLLQFLPRYEWINAENLGASVLVPDAAPQGTAPHSTDSDALAEVIDYCDSRCQDLLRAVVSRGCTIPEIGFELMDSSGRVCAQAELAWPNDQIAVFLPEADESKSRFAAEGWSVFGIDNFPDDIKC